MGSRHTQEGAHSVLVIFCECGYPVFRQPFPAMLVLPQEEGRAYLPSPLRKPGHGHVKNVLKSHASIQSSGRKMALWTAFSGKGGIVALGQLFKV